MRWKSSAGLLALSTVLAVLKPIDCRADTIFSNLGAGQTYDTSQAVGIGTFIQGQTADVYSRASSFTVPSGVGYLLSQIDIPLMFLANVSPPNAFVVRLRLDATGSPGNPIASWTLTDVPPLPPVPVLFSIQPSQTIAGISGITLAPNTTYWVSAEGAAATGFGAWIGCINCDGVFYTSVNGGPWSADPGATGKLAFDVIGTPVPEPGPFFSLFVGLIAVVVMKRQWLPKY